MDSSGVFGWRLDEEQKRGSSLEVDEGGKIIIIKKISGLLPEPVFITGFLILLTCFAVVCACRL